MNRVIILGACAVGLLACGPGAKIGGGKDGAAQAFFAATKPTQAGSEKSGTPVDLTGNVSWTCPEGGSAELSGFQAVIGTGSLTSVGQSFTLKYNNCGLAKSDVGVAVYNGGWDVTQSVIAGAGGVDIEQKFKGKIQVQGAFDDFLDADVSQKVSVSSLGSGAGSVNMELKGSIATSTESHAFDGAISITAGTIIATVPKR